MPGFGSLALLLASAGVAALVGRRLAIPISKALAKREAAETRYQAYWDHTGESLFIVRVLADDHFEYEAINPSLERLSGLSTADVKGRTPYQCLNPEDAEAVTANYRRCVTEGKTICFERTFTFASGLRRLETILAPIRDSRTEAIVQLCGSCRDITEKASFQHSLQQSEMRFREMAETVPSIVFTASANGQLTYVNRRFYDYSGLPSILPSGSFYEYLVHPDDLRAVRASLRFATAATEPFKVECRLRSSSNDYRWFLIRCRPVVSGDQIQWFGIATSIHTLKAIETDLKRSNAELESLISSISDCYFTVDHQWTCRRNNKRAEEWFGSDQAPLTGSNLGELKILNPLFRSAINSALTMGETVHRELQFSSSDRRWISVHIYPSKDGASIFFHDITARKLAEFETAKSKELLQSTLDALYARIAILTEDGTILAVNKSWEASAHARGNGHSVHSIGSSYLEECESDALRAGITRMIQQRRPRFRCTYHSDKKPGGRWYQTRVSRFEIDDMTRIVVTHEDVTKIVNTRQEVTELAGRLLSLQEEERQRIASDLHDSTSQYLVAAGLSMMKMRNLTKGADETQRLCDDIDALLDEALREIRTFTYLLHPQHLDSDGLKSTVERFARGFSGRTSLEVRVDINEVVDELPFELQRSVLRVIQEALTNVHRHAEATEVRIEADVVNSQFHLKISDDGSGMPVNILYRQPTATYGVGVPGMRARLHQHGGWLSIRDNPNAQRRGTLIQAVIPLPFVNQIHPAPVSTPYSRAN